MKSLIYLLVINIALGKVVFDYPKDKGIIILDKSNFEKFVNSNDIVLVAFYAINNDKYKEFEPKYSKIADELMNKNDIPVAKVDAYLSLEITKKYKIQQVPSFLLFIQGLPLNYEHPLTIPNMVKYTLNTKMYKSKTLDDLEELEEFRSKNDLLAVYYGEIDNNIKTFELIANKYEDIKFVNITEEEYVNKFKTNTVILYKRNDKIQHVYDNKDFNIFELDFFFEKHRYNTVMEFSQISSEKIFKNGEDAIFLIHTKENEFMQEFKEVAANYRNELNFSNANYDTVFGKQLYEFLQLNKNYLPSIFIVKFTKKGIEKFHLDKTINKESIKEFIKGYKLNKLEKFYISEEVPYNKNLVVKKVVKNNYDELVIKNDINVLMYAYIDKCDKCDKFEPEFEKLAKLLKNNKSIELVQVNVSRNDIPLQFKNFPEIKLFKKLNKSVATDYEGDLKIDKILEFLKKNLFKQISEEL